MVACQLCSTLFNSTQHRKRVSLRNYLDGLACGHGCEGLSWLLTDTGRSICCGWHCSLGKSSRTVQDKTKLAEAKHPRIHEVIILFALDCRYDVLSSCLHFPIIMWPGIVSQINLFFPKLLFWVGLFCHSNRNEPRTETGIRAKSSTTTFLGNIATDITDPWLQNLHLICSVGACLSVVSYKWKIPHGASKDVLWI